MKRLSPLALTLAAALCAGGCSHVPFFGKKKPDAPLKEKADPRVATQMELQFQQRWVDKRAADLVATGLSPDVARAQANQEYQQKFNYAQPAAR
jgi:hypothetical protein